MLASGARLLGARREFGVGRIPDLDERETACGDDRELARALGRVTQFRHAARGQPAATGREACPDEGPHHRVTEGIGAHSRDENPVVVARPAELLEGADRRRPLPGPAERREVVQTEEAAGRLVHRILVEGGRMPEFETPSSRVTHGPGVGDPVLVAAPDGGESRVEPLRRGARSLDLHVARRSRDAVEATHEGVETCRCPPASTRAIEMRALGLIEVEVRDLPRRVHADVRASRDGQGGRFPGAAEHRRESGLEFTLNRAQPRLLRPAREAAAVVGDVEPDPGHLTSLPHRATLEH